MIACTGYRKVACGNHPTSKTLTHILITLFQTPANDESVLPTSRPEVEELPRRTLSRFDAAESSDANDNSSSNNNLLQRPRKISTSTRSRFISRNNNNKNNDRSPNFSQSSLLILATTPTTPDAPPTTPAPDFALVRQPSARPLRVSPRPEEELFRQISNNFEPSQPEPLPVVQTNNAVAAATALPITPLRTTTTPEPPTTLRRRLPTATRRPRPRPVVTTSAPEYEYEYYYTYEDYNEDSAFDNGIPEPRSKPVKTIDDYDLGQFSTKVKGMQ